MHQSLGTTFCASKVQLQEVESCKPRDGLDEGPEIRDTCDSSPETLRQQRDRHGVGKGKVVIIYFKNDERLQAMDLELLCATRKICGRNSGTS
jgi:hypothetical protein